MRDAARTFLAKLADSGIPASALESVYVHFLAVHVQGQVEKLGPLWYWSGEGLEHKNLVWKQTGRAVAQRGLAPHQNGGRKPRDGGPQRRIAGGRNAQTAVWVIAGEEHGGTAREGHVVRSRHAIARALA